MSTRSRLLLVTLSCLASVAAGCGGSTPTDGGTDATAADGGTDAAADDAAVDAGAWARPECEGLNPENCMLPWPSARYLVDDTATSTHRRVSIPREAMPANGTGDRIDPAELNRWNGFSGQTSFMTLHRGVLDGSNLADWQHIDQSLAMGSPTVLLDVTDVAHPVRVAHWAELDVHGDIPSGLRPLYVRPARRLEENHHYVVAIRGLHAMDGSAVAPYENFRLLRDNVTPAPAYIESRRARFEAEVFAPLTTAGVDRASLIEAWDIWTGTDDMAYQDLIDARDAALTAAGTNGIGCTITSMVEPTMTEDDHIFRKVYGTVTVPLLSMVDMPGSPLRRGTDGKPMASGTTEVTFTLEIPRSVATSVGGGGAPVRLIQYGHGLFGGQDEVEGGYMRQFIDDYPSVAVASDWAGMSAADVGYATDTLSDISKFSTFVDRQIQGIVNFAIVIRTLKGVCAGNAAFQVSGHPTFDPTKVYYHGNSQGGIFGMTYAGISTDIDHFGIGVGAASYGVFMPRSIDWKAYSLVVSAWYHNSTDRYLILSMLTQMWERSDPSVFTVHTLDHVLPGSPTGKRILMQIGRGDAQVHNVGSDLAARNYGIPYYMPSTYPEYGLTAFTDVSDSGYTMYDTGATPVPDTCTYLDGMEPENAHMQTVHEAVRRDPRAQMQLDQFLQPGGRVHNTCGAGATCAPLP